MPRIAETTIVVYTVLLVSSAAGVRQRYGPPPGCAGTIRGARAPARVGGRRRPGLRRRKWVAPTGWAAGSWPRGAPPRDDRRARAPHRPAPPCASSGGGRR